MKKRPEKNYATHAEYLDPLDCDSLIGYNIMSRCRYRLRASVDLTDCNRKIQWYFNAASGLKKIDKVIEILSAFRKDFIAAQLQERRPIARKRK